MSEETPRKRYVIRHDGELLMSAEGVVWVYDIEPALGHSMLTYDLSFIAGQRGVLPEDLTVEEQA